jgi:hypothetical protein
MTNATNKTPALVITADECAQAGASVLARFDGQLRTALVNADKASMTRFALTLCMVSAMRQHYSNLPKPPHGIKQVIIDTLTKAGFQKSVATKDVTWTSHLFGDRAGASALTTATNAAANGNVRDVLAALSAVGITTVGHVAAHVKGTAAPGKAPKTMLPADKVAASLRANGLDNAKAVRKLRDAIIAAGSQKLLDALIRLETAPKANAKAHAA